MRRIEAVTGEAAETLMEERFRLLEEATRAVGAQGPEQLPVRIEELRRSTSQGRRSDDVTKPAAAAREAKLTPLGPFVAYIGDFGSVEALKAWAKEVRGALGPGVIAAGISEPEPQLFVTVSPDLVAAGVDASVLVREAVAVSGGKGGGRPDMAQGRTSGPDGLQRAMETLRERLQG